MADRILRSISNTTVLNTTSSGYVSLDVDLRNYQGVTNASSITCGDVIINTSVIDVGWDGLGNGTLISNGMLQTGQVSITSTNLSIGTSQGAPGNGGLIINSDTLILGNVTITPANLMIGHYVYGEGGGILLNKDNLLLGNAVAINNSVLTVGNSSIFFNRILVGNDVVNASINTTSITCSYDGGANGTLISNNQILVGGLGYNTYLSANMISVKSPTYNAFISPYSISVGNSSSNSTVNTTVLASGLICTFISNVGNLPSAPLDGTRAFVNDATLALVNNAGESVSGGGNNHVPVYYDGGSSQWRLG